MLHIVSGGILGLIGFLLVYLMNKTAKEHELKLSPKFVALFTFTFALAAGVIWEIFEFLVDVTLNTNMQRWADIPAQPLIGRLEQGIGLLDTMGDLIIDTIGGLVAAVAGYIYLKEKEENKKISRFIGRIFQDLIDFAHMKKSEK